MVAILSVTGAVLAAACGLLGQSARAASACAATSGTVTSFATLQSDVATGGTYTLGASMSPSSGSLTLGSGAHVTLNLAGCALDIASPAAGDAAIAIPANASLTIEDTSATNSGQLTAVGGAALSDTAGSADGIGGDAGVSSGPVTLAGGSVTATPGALDGSTGTAGFGIDGAVKVSTATTTLDATLGGALTVAAGATLTVPSGDTLSVNATDASAASTNAGEIDLAGTFTGEGTMSNTGTIVVSGSSWSIPGNGKGGPGKLTITGTIYELTFGVPSGHTTPAPLWVYAPTISGGGETLPTQPAETGYTAVWESGSTPVSNASGLAGLSTLKLTGVYLAGTSVRSAVTSPASGSLADTATVTRAAGTGSPSGSVSFYVCGPLSSASGCNSTGNEVGSAVSLSAAGSATSTATSQTYTPSAAGIYCFHTVYSPSGSFTGSSDASSGCATVQEPTQVSTPTASANPVSAGQTLTLAATVTNTSGSEALNGGMVTFADTDGATVCTATVAASGVASCGVSTLSLGIHQITASYGGDTQFLPSSETTPETQDIDQPFSAPTTTKKTTSGLTKTKSLPSDSVRLLSKLAARSGRLTIKLKLPDAGRLELTVTVTKAHRTVTYAALSTRSKRSETLTLHLAPSTAAARLLGPRHTRERLKLAVTFTPTGGKLRTVRTTLKLPAA